jgi:hypothetical protein
MMNTNGILASGPVPNEVGAFTNANKMTITWEITEGGTTYPAGTTRIPIYVLYAQPRVGSQYLTLLDMSATAAAGDTAADDVVSDVYALYQGAQQSPPAPLHRRTLDPASGDVTVDTASGPLRYYLPWTWDADINSTYSYGCNTLYEVLSELLGRCGAWALVFERQMAEQGIDAPYAAAETLPGFPAHPPGPGGGYGFVKMLVKNWTFVNGNPLLVPWPYETKATVGAGGVVTYAPKNFDDAAGLPGQGNPNPPGWFDYGDHALVQYGGRIYDPSYGTGPFADVCAWAKASLDGFSVQRRVGATLELRATNSVTC